MHTAIREISTIIERDSKDTTYKFALLRACIQICQEYEHFAEKEKDKVTFPLGFIVIKWLEYYYAIFADQRFIPQKNGDSPKKSLAFRNAFLKVINLYKDGLGFYQFQRNLKDGKLDDKQRNIIAELVKVIRETIVKMPMHYIGGSINKGGEIFKYNKDSNFSIRKLDVLSDEYVIKSCGTFSIPKNYFDAFLLLGSFINGTNSILLEWVDFTIRADKKKIFSRGEILNLIDPMYDKERNVNEIKIFFERLKKKTELYCIWSGNRIINDLTIDHLMPYSLWKNNDFWNLLPTKSIINSKKSDKIPSSNLLSKRKDLIINYWEILFNAYPIRFKKEMQISLLGVIPFAELNWQKECFQSLTNKCDYLTYQRGFEPFNI